MQDKILVADRLDTLAQCMRRGIRHPKGSLLVSTAAAVIRELAAERDQSDAALRRSMHECERLRAELRAIHDGWRQ